MGAFSIKQEPFASPHPKSLLLSVSVINEETYKEVYNIFSAYLEQKGQRKTNERYAILQEIYSRTDHFEAEQLYLDLTTNKGINVSRATIYNTLELLVSCDLIKKHQFGKNQAQYEKSYGYKQHDHIICVDCKKVVEFCDPRIQQIRTMMGELLNFKITHHSLYCYGVCGTCQVRRELEQKASKN
jgi:Fur family ferric uptake transcriptional regulator